MGLLSFQVEVEEPQEMEMLLERPTEMLAEELLVVPLHNQRLWLFGLSPLLCQPWFRHFGHATLCMTGV